MLPNDPLSLSSSQAEAVDPAKDAQETADDAAHLKKFKNIQLVGTGKYARVYKVLTEKGKELAIKSINLSKTSDNYREKFLPRELNILRKLQHNNICRTYEITQVVDRVFIVMQFCPKGTIADLLHRLGPLSEPVSRYIFGQVLDAVSYMHSMELAHRDLKVENILLDSDFVPKLTDFSYSIILNERSPHASGSSPTRLNYTFCGTVPYLSPEMIKQLPYDPKKTDVWSMGVSLFVMLNDRLPFPFDDVKVMLKKQMSKEYKFRTNVEFSDSVRDIMWCMLEPIVGKRPSSADLIKHPWLRGRCEKPHY